MNDNHNEDEAPFDGTSEDSTLEDQMSAHIAAIAASGVAAEAEALANRQADMAARERRETRVVPELLRTLVFARPCGGDQFAAGTVSPSLDMSR